MIVPSVMARGRRGSTLFIKLFIVFQSERSVYVLVISERGYASSVPRRLDAVGGPNAVGWNLSYLELGRTHRAVSRGA